ncbi:poly(rC)-binding protein 3 isoform X11 [Sarcophilus harrisii]|uniref:poly(rC)-binding protein 3 isoform X11 n=1 Tax=Sarcophilus harrisii TaxID=9305 RepID=UPI001301A45C|nr:poly(rC)-binding protein 3 isoform X11 [Sarcophilus harrisii]
MQGCCWASHRGGSVRALIGRLCAALGQWSQPPGPALHFPPAQRRLCALGGWDWLKELEGAEPASVSGLGRRRRCRRPQCNPRPTRTSPCPRTSPARRSASERPAPVQQAVPSFPGQGLGLRIWNGERPYTGANGNRAGRGPHQKRLQMEETDTALGAVGRGRPTEGGGGKARINHCSFSHCLAPHSWYPLNITVSHQMLAVCSSPEERRDS